MSKKDKGKTTAPKAELPKGKGTQNTKPAASNPPAIPRDKGKDGKAETTTDTVRKTADKARWEYGAGTGETADMLAEQREIERRQREGKGGEGKGGEGKGGEGKGGEGKGGEKK